MIIPRATEKAYAEEAKHTYVFFVPKKASKQEIAKAIAEAFKVTVVDVRTTIRKGKATLVFLAVNTLILALLIAKIAKLLM